MALLAAGGERTGRPTRRRPAVRTSHKNAAHGIVTVSSTQYRGVPRRLRWGKFGVLQLNSVYLNQSPWHTLVGSITRPPPFCRICHRSRADGVHVAIIDFLYDRLFAPAIVIITSFLPQVVSSLAARLYFQLIEDRRILQSQMIQDPPRRSGFEFADCPSEFHG